MQTRGHTLANGQVLIIREAVEDDAPLAIAFADATSRESEFLTFGPGEFRHTETQERAFIRSCLGSSNRLFILGSIDDMVVSLLHCVGGDRPRTQHAGEFGVSVRRPYWGMGIASLMIETLVGWADAGGALTKLNLRVRSDHARAIALFDRKGFRVEGTTTRAVRVAGQYYDHLWMGRELRDT